MTLIRANTPPYILDVEASGFGATSYPIEVGVALGPGSRFSTLIIPVRGWTHWDDSAQAVHGIPRQTLLDHGKPVAQVARWLNSLLHGETIYSDGWVVDKPWMTQLFFEAGLRMEFQLSPIELIQSEAQTRLWGEVKAQVENDLPATRHRASHDAWIIQETYVRSRQSISVKEA